MDSELNKEQLKNQRKIDEASYKADMVEEVNKFPDYTSKEFTFSQLEQTMLAEQDTIIALSQQTKQKFLNLYVLGRVGIRFNRDVRVLYSVGLGKFTVFLPKVSNKVKD